MADKGPEQVAVEPPRRHRWLRRELWFVLAAIILISVVTLVVSHKSQGRTASGRPDGIIPVRAAATFGPRPATPPR